MDKLRPYYRCLLIAVLNGARDTNEIIEVLKRQGWKGYSLIPEVAERSLREIGDNVHDLAFILEE